MDDDDESEDSVREISLMNACGVDNARVKGVSVGTILPGKCGCRGGWGTVERKDQQLETRRVARL